jgi:hypothetical protein
MISAISPRGEVAFRIVDGTINAERFKEFLAALIEEAKGGLKYEVQHTPGGNVLRWKRPTNS